MVAPRLGLRHIFFVTDRNVTIWVVPRYSSAASFLVSWKSWRTTPIILYIRWKISQEKDFKTTRLQEYTVQSSVTDCMFKLFKLSLGPKSKRCFLHRMHLDVTKVRQSIQSSLPIPSFMFVFALPFEQTGLWPWIFACFNLTFLAYVWD